MKNFIKKYYLIGLLFTVVLIAPVCHYYYISSKYRLNKLLKENVYLISADGERGNATAFPVDGPTGPLFITNRHVCEMLKGRKDIYVQHPTSYVKTRAHIKRMSEETDLCSLVTESEPEYAFKVAKARQWEEVRGSGYPLFTWNLPFSGKILSVEGTAQYIGSYELIFNIDACLPVEEVGVDGFLNCYKYNQVHRLSMQIRPGHSGSPIINKYGQVVGVVYAFNTETGLGVAVMGKDLIKFISEHN